MAHEALDIPVSLVLGMEGGGLDVLRYALQHAAWFEDEGGEGDSAQVCTRSKLRDDVPEHISLIGLDNQGVIVACVSSALVVGSPAA